VSAVTCTGTIDDLVSKHGAVADFVAVYITEAHARDEWPAGSKLSNCNQPTNTEERLQLANMLVKTKQVSVPVLVDSIDNSFENVYSCWPIRFYVLYRGKVAFKAQPTANMNGYDFNDVSRCLETLGVSR